MHKLSLYVQEPTQDTGAELWKAIQADLDMPHSIVNSFIPGASPVKA